MASTTDPASRPAAPRLALAGAVAAVLVLAAFLTGVLDLPLWARVWLASPLVQGIVIIALGVGGCFGYFYGANLLLDRVVFPPVARSAPKPVARWGLFLAPVLLVAVGLTLPTLVVFAQGGSNVFAAVGVVAAAGAVARYAWRFAGWAFPPEGTSIGDNIRRASEVRPWLFLAPAIFALGLYLCYPVVGSFVRSLYGRAGTEFVGFDNYVNIMREGGFRALLNNVGWIFVVPALSTFFGLIAAQLTDKIRWGAVAKSIIFMPMAISFVGASLIWRFVYVNDMETGLVNALRGVFGAERAIDVLQIPIWNNFFLMIIMVWMQTGFAMVILSAALRGIPEETVEAAIIDGANPFQIFFRIQVPQITNTILVVWTTITVLVLKIFDIVYTMTGGNYNTEILPSYMMDYMFLDDGRATAVAFVIMLIVLPVMYWNIRQARSEEA